MWSEYELIPILYKTRAFSTHWLVFNKATSCLQQFKFLNMFILYKRHVLFTDIDENVDIFLLTFYAPA